VTDLSIVIVSWNGRELLLDCLASIEREVRSRIDAARLETETLVVDQASTDGSAAMVRERFPWAEVIELSDNVGFAAGNNVALRRAKGRHCVLLNNDTVVLRDGLEKCVRYLDAHPDVGVVGPQLLNLDGSKQNSVHATPNFVTEIVPKGLLERVAPWRFPSKRFDHAGPVTVEAVLGACLVVRREVLDDVGLMPEAYFFFLEETDWCLRIRRAGWKVVHVPDARVIHVHGATTKRRVPAETRIEYHRSLYTFFRTHRGEAAERRLVAIRMLKGLFYAATGWIPGLVSSRARHRWVQNLRVLAWHLRGRPEREGLEKVVRPQREGGPGMKDPVPKGERG
jgi:GT2 family glycosyltransferase